MLDDLKEERIVNKVGSASPSTRSSRMVALNTALPARDMHERQMAIVIAEIIQDKIYLDVASANPQRNGTGTIQRHLQ